MTKKLFSWLPFTLTLAVAVGVVWQRQNILDWWRLRSYDPPARISQLAADTTMTSHGRKLFLVNHPTLDDKVTFSTHCRIGEESIILGCYVSGQGIYIYDVSDPRLVGIHEVTAAHEMLHAAYDRLSGKEKDQIDKQLLDFFATITDERIIKTVESYRSRDPSVVPNELHSIIATEVRNIPPALETYFARYFEDRLKVVTYSERYEQAFTDIKNRVEAYDNELADLKTQIAANEAQLEATGAEINAERARLDAMLAADNTSGYNAAVPGFNQMVRRYNGLLEETRSLIERYNSLVEERNQLAAAQQELIDAIDSRLPSQQQQ